MSNNQNNPQEVKMFRVLLGYDKKDIKNVPSLIPWDMLNEEQAKRNHSQTLTRLNERGGMCVTEILANIYKQDKRDWTVTQETVDELNKLVTDFLTPQEVPQVKSVQEIDVDNFMQIGKASNAKGADIFLIAHNKAELWATFDPDEGEPNEVTRAEREEAYRSYQKGFTDCYYTLTPVVDARIVELETSNDLLKKNNALLRGLNDALQAENAKLREGLYSVIGYPSYSNHKIHEPLKAIAEQALNSKEG